CLGAPPSLGIRPLNAATKQKDCHSVRTGAPLALAHFFAGWRKPGDIVDAQATRGPPAEPGALAENWMGLAEGNDLAGKVQQGLIDGFPIEPGNFFVLAIGVVVAGLSAAEFISTQQHRHAL